MKLVLINNFNFNIYKNPSILATNIFPHNDTLVAPLANIPFTVSKPTHF